MATTNENFALMISLVTVNASGLVLNFLVVLMFLRFRHQLLTINNNKFLFSMAIADSLVGLYGIVGAVLYYLQIMGSVTEKLRKLCCTLPLFGSFYLSILTLGVLTMDRLISVVYPFRYHSLLTEVRANALVCSTWLAVAMILIIQGGILLGLSASIELEVRTYQLTFFFILGLFVLCVGNIKLYRIIRSKQDRGSTVGSGNNNYLQSKKVICYGNIPQPKRISGVFSYSKICIWMTTVFIICWLPLTLEYTCYINFCYPESRIYYIFCLCLANINSFLNPVIYLMNRRTFRTRFCMLVMLCNGNRGRSIGATCTLRTRHPETDI